MKYIIIAATLLTTLTIVFACAPEFPVAVFSYQRHPDFPRTEYLNGRLGILQPTYARSYLVLAYRYLSGKALDIREKEQVKEYWKDRGSGHWDKVGSDSARSWVAARNRVAQNKVKAEGSISKSYGYDEVNHDFYQNCAEDAYRTAARTLEDRVARFGAKSRAVQEWLKAQDTVFSNCDADKASIPLPATADLPAIIRADRDYQTAAAHFYAGDRQAAVDGFRKIAADSSSPWHEIAPYLVVRTLVRERKPKQWQETIRKEGERILENPAAASIHGMTRVLLWRAEVIDDDEDYFLGLARDLSARGQDRDMREEMWDFTTMYDRVIGEDLWSDEKKPIPNYRALLRSSDLPDWIYSFQSESREEKVHAVARWKKTHSTPWLVAALSHAQASDAASQELVDAGAAIPTDAPEYLTVAFHRLRLLNDLGQAADVRASLDDLLAGKVTLLPKSAVNQLRSLRMLSAGSMPDYLRFAQRFPLMITWTDDVAEVGRSDADMDPEENAKPDITLPRLDRDSIKILNERTPLRLWLEAAGDPELPKSWRRQFALTTLTRALLLDNDPAIQEACKLLVPEMHEAAKLLDAVTNASDVEERRFAGIFLILHYPESRPYLVSGMGREGDNGKIDGFHENWWRLLDSGGVELDAYSNWLGGLWGNGTRKRTDADRAAEHAMFLDPRDRTLGRDEFKRMAATRSAVSYLTSQVLTFAHAHPSDPRLAEALHLAIRATRWGVSDPDSWRLTKQAFQLLHRNYPNSSWAKKTPIWYRQPYFGDNY
jgi:hypothetical protein